MTMPAGTYYVGDLCYVMHDVWDEVCSTTFNDMSSTSEYVLGDGRKFVMMSTSYGDGCYNDQSGREYPVDSGTIGCIKIVDIAKHELKGLSEGNIIEFAKDFIYENVDGVLFFGDISINTAYDESDEDEEY